MIHLNDKQIEESLHSAWITFVSLAGGFLMAAVAAGATTPVAVLAYAKANWLVWVTANLIAPTVRMYRARDKDPQP